MKNTLDMVDPELKQTMANTLGLAHISDKTALILDMMDKGHSIEVAHKLVTGKDRLPDSTKSNINKKSEMWLIGKPDMQKLAHNAVRDTLKMKPITVKDGPDSDDKKYIYPSVSNRMAAANMVLDRTEPVKAGGPSQQGNTFINIDMREYQAPQDDVSGISEDNGPVIESNEIKELSHG